jgi:7,8-dihydropterin-6-yl-methyl-4-(beta-D-ribofuranosyl)aminobenzene 5'-phosphate synthase
MSYGIIRGKGGKIVMKKHRFFAWMTVICFLLTMMTGYKKK